MREKRFDLVLAHVGWMSPLVGRAMEMQELDNPMTVGLLRRDGIVQRTHLVGKLIKQLLASVAWIRLCIARNRHAIRRRAVFG